MKVMVDHDGLFPDDAPFGDTPRNGDVVVTSVSGGTLLIGRANRMGSTETLSVVSGVSRRAALKRACGYVHPDHRVIFVAVPDSTGPHYRRVECASLDD
jgi:hypothetical protein